MALQQDTYPTGDGTEAGESDRRVLIALTHGKWRSRLRIISETVVCRYRHGLAVLHITARDALMRARDKDSAGPERKCMQLAIVEEYVLHESE